MNVKLEAYKGLISFLGKALPEEFDAILFDLTEKGYPAVEKSDWGRRNERDVRRLLLEVIKEGCDNEDEGTLGRITSTADKQLEKASFYFIKDGDRKVGALAISMGLDVYLRMSTFLADKLDVKGFDGSSTIAMTGYGQRERVMADPMEIEDMVKEFTPDPSKLTPTERKELFLDIYDTGIFRVKGAIPKAAEAMGISEQTVYRYISEIKKMRK